MKFHVEISILLVISPHVMPDPKGLGNSEKWVKGGNAITILCIEKLSHCYHGYNDLFIVQILRSKFVSSTQGSLLNYAPSANNTCRFLITLKISLNSLVSWFTLSDNIFAFEAQWVLRKPEEEEEESSHNFVMLEFLGFPYKNILSYNVRSLHVISGQMLWFLAH